MTIRSTTSKLKSQTKVQVRKKRKGVGGKKKGFVNDSRGSLIYFDSGVKVHLQLEIVRKVEVFKLA